MAYNFNGKRITALNRLVLEVVKQYVKEHPEISYSELKKIFRDDIGGSRGMIKNKEEFEGWKQNIKDPEKRFFIKDNEAIQLEHDVVYVNQGWGGDWIDNKTKQRKEGNKKRFLAFATNELRYRIDSDNTNEEENPLEIEEKGQNMLNTKNIILYGAPGVGKTYNYKNLISMIEEGKGQKEIFDTITENRHVNLENKTFEIIKQEKRVDFVTFHQSYSYEDFIEGYRPNESGNIKLEDGIFKKLSNDSEINLLKSKDNKEVVFIEALNILLKEKIENEEKIRVQLKRKDSYFTIYDFNDKTIYFEKQNGDQSHTLSIKTLEKMYYEGENNIIHGGLAPYYNPLLEKLLKLKNKTDGKTEEQKNFYIVIDEINRGNISKVFGELITLIEEDKRDVYEVTLPYSKEKFKVPSNLYIIATMNSTDKSIATIDIALRRRFTFLKMKPNEELIDFLPAKELFNALNKFIMENLNEDYQLGHSYFMKVQTAEDLKFVKEYKIKPLLEEYFYVDKNKINEALNLLKIENSNE